MNIFGKYTISTRKIDFVILDEIHFTKNEDSDRRDNLNGLLTKAYKKNLIKRK